MSDDASAKTFSAAPRISISNARPFREYCSMLESMEEDGVSEFRIVACGSAIGRAASFAKIAIDKHGYELERVNLRTLESQERPITTQQTFHMRASGTAA
jgi:hypothetical protein